MKVSWPRVGDGFWIGVLIGVAVILLIAARFVTLEGM